MKKIVALRGQRTGTSVLHISISMPNLKKKDLTIGLQNVANQKSPNVTEKSLGYGPFACIFQH